MSAEVAKLIASRKRQDRIFEFIGAMGTLVGIATLLALVAKLAWSGLAMILRLEYLASGTPLIRAATTLLIALALASLAGFLTARILDSLASAGRRINWAESLLAMELRSRNAVLTLVAALIVAYATGLSRSVFAGGVALSIVMLPFVIATVRRWLIVRREVADQPDGRRGDSQLASNPSADRKSLPGPTRQIGAIGILLIAAAGAIAWNEPAAIFRTEFFFSNADTIEPASSGILMAWVGSLYVMLVTFLTAVPLGVAAAIYLEEYARKNWFVDLIEINISNLAGVPSITYGLMALWLFGYLLGLSSSVLVGGLTLALLVLPIIIVTTREALRSIPNSIREAAYAAGATKWQTIRYHLLPYSLGGIATGTIIAMSRAVGETAPLIVIGAAGWVSHLPPSPVTSQPPFLSIRWLFADFTVLPLQMFTWAGDPDPAYQDLAAAAGLVLIVFTLSVNALAIVLRYRVRQRLKW